jgi:hypothetical protein
MDRVSPFADLAEGPAPDAVVLPLLRPSRAAFGCVTLAALFFAVSAMVALGYAITGTPFAPAYTAALGLRITAVVFAVLFLAVVVALVIAAVRVARTRHGVAFDSTGVWWRDGDRVAAIPWAEFGLARMTTPVFIRGLRSSAPRTPTLQLCPVTNDTLRSRRPLADRATIISEDEPTGPRLWLAFQLLSTADATAAAEAVRRYAPEQWVAGQPADQDSGSSKP